MSKHFGMANTKFSYWTFNIAMKVVRKIATPARNLASVIKMLSTSSHITDWATPAHIYQSKSTLTQKSFGYYYLLEAYINAVWCSWCLHQHRMHNSHCLTDGVAVHGFHYMMMHKPARSLPLGELSSAAKKCSKFCHSWIGSYTHTHTHTHINKEVLLQ